MPRWVIPLVIGAALSGPLLRLLWALIRALVRRRPASEPVLAVEYRDATGAPVRPYALPVAGATVPPDAVPVPAGDRLEWPPLSPVRETPAAVPPPARRVVVVRRRRRLVRVRRLGGPAL